MLAVLAGSVAAMCWTVASLAASRAARAAGPRVVLAWVMLIGLVLAVPITIAGGIPPLDTEAWTLLAIAGFGNVIGLSLTYAAFASGKVSVAAPIISTEGALAAVIAVLLGEPMELGVAAALALIAIGVILAAREQERATSGEEDLYHPIAAPEPALTPEPDPPGHVVDAASQRRSVLLAVAAAASFSLGLYATGRIGAELSVGLTVLPSRLAGFALVTLPFLVAGRLALPGRVMPLVALVGVLEVVGVIAIAVGATDAIAVTAVMSSQFAGIAALAAYFLFGERLSRTQVGGIVAIGVGVAAVALLRASAVAPPAA